jgi:hypothetical protein
MYQTILSNTAPNGVQQGQGVDPLNPTNNPNIDWSDNTTDTNILAMLSEHSFELEYRDDLQVMTTNVYSDTPSGLCYLPGTCHAFGNNGMTAYYGSVNFGANTSLNNRLVTNAPVFISAMQLYLDLTNASDHLPVVADYNIPLSAPVITGISLAERNLIFNVANSITGAVFTVWVSTNATLPFSNWTALATNLSNGGSFSFTATNVVDQSAPGQFFILQEN